MSSEVGKFSCEYCSERSKKGDRFCHSAFRIPHSEFHQIGLHVVPLGPSSRTIPRAAAWVRISSARAQFFSLRAASLWAIRFRISSSFIALGPQESLALTGEIFFRALLEEAQDPPAFEQGILSHTQEGRGCRIFSESFIRQDSVQHSGQVVEIPKGQGGVEIVLHGLKKILFDRRDFLKNLLADPFQPGRV